MCLLPSKSALHINGRLSKTDVGQVKITKFINNAICHSLEEIRYEINAVEIDKCKYVGLTSTMKGLASFSPKQSTFLANSG